MNRIERIIHIVDNISRVNFGIWNAAIATSGVLKKFGFESQLWAPEEEDIVQTPELEFVSYVQLSNTGWAGFQEALAGLDKDRDLIVTHGCWQFPTRWGSWFAEKGFRWIYTPHGMLEPWAMQQKRWKKLIYFHIYERQFVAKATQIRAVSSNEARHLAKLFPGSSVHTIVNGVHDTVFDTERKAYRQFLFMSRLHQKKGILPFVKGWLRSELNNNSSYNLVIAGPDQGELVKLRDLVAGSSNISYVGAKYGSEKEELLSTSGFFVLTSFSEGFPTALLEAMQRGLIPVMSNGCNFPEAFNEGVAIHAEPDPMEIAMVLNSINHLTDQHLTVMSSKAADFIRNNYTLNNIALQQNKVYRSI